MTSRFWLAYENDPTEPLAGPYPTDVQARAATEDLRARVTTRFVLIDDVGRVVESLAPGPTALEEVVATLGAIVDRCPPASPAAERAATYLACAIVRDRRRAEP